MNDLIKIYPARDFSVPGSPSAIVKANVPRQATLVDAWRVQFQVDGRKVILTNGYAKPEWRTYLNPVAVPTSSGLTNGPGPRPDTSSFSLQPSALPL